MLFSRDKESVKLNNRIIKPDKYAFSQKICRANIGSRVRVISSAAFLGCRGLTDVTFSEGVKELGDNVFTNCASLSEITLPDSLGVVGEFAFKDCRGLRQVKLPTNLECLPKGAFKNCTSLQRIVLPPALRIIGDECFSGCTGLKEIVFDGNNLKSIGKKAFKRCESLQEITFPESLEEIDDFAFNFCKNLRYVKLKKPPLVLGKQPFMRRVCSNLTASEKAFVSSFVVDGSEDNCPTVSVPDNPRFLALGFDGILSDFGADKQKTCFNHVLSLDRQSIKLFVGENYYSYNNDNDYIIENGKFDFLKYDKQFSKATDFEKPFIAAYRLVYNHGLTDEFKAVYEASLAGREKDAAVFAVERNEASLLVYLFEKYDYDTDFYVALYNIALKNGNRNLLDIIPVSSKKSGMAETENLFGDLL